MPKVKVHRQSTRIDMTAMCDVAFLLLNFFMLTSNFTAKESVQVSSPSSVSEIKIPEVNIMKILVDPNGKVFFGIDGQERRAEILDKIAEKYTLKFNAKERHNFSLLPTFGVPVNKLNEFLNLPPEIRDSKDWALGIPTDSIDNQFKEWIKAAREVGGKETKIAIKADQKTPYPKFKNVMGTLQDLDENRYNLITSLEEMPRVAKQ